MRRGCQWLCVLLLVGGCVGPGEREQAGTGGGAPAATPARETEPESAGAALGMGAAEAREFLASRPEALLLDVRNPDEWSGELGHIEGARLIPLPELPSRVAEIEGWKEKPVVVVCRSGNRSARAAELLREAGYRQVFNLEGGMLSWRATEGAKGR